MNWTAQVRHVAAKDFRRARWLFVLYAIATACATLAIGGWLSSRALEMSTLGYLLLPFAMMITASVVQDDSPSRSDAFWVTKPLAPSAMVAAKVCVVTIGIIGVALVGQVFILAAYRLPAGESAVLLTRSVAGELVLLLTAMTIAALTPDFHYCLLTLAALFVARQFLPAFFTGAEFPVVVSGVVHSLLLIIPIAVWLGVAVDQYRWRDVRRGRALGFAAAVLTGLIPPTIVSAGALSATGANVARSDASIWARAVSFSRNSNGQMISVDFNQPDADATDRRFLRVVRGYLVAPDGRTEAIRMWAGVVLDRPLPQLPGVRWLGDRGPFFMSSSGELSREQMQALQRGDVRLRIEGTLITQRPELVARVRSRCESGSTASAPHTRLRVIDLASDERGPIVRAQIVRILSSEDRVAPRSIGLMQAASEPMYALVNESRGEAIPLQVSSSAGSGIGLPLLGADANQMRAELTRIE